MFVDDVGVYTALECVTERVLGTKSIWTNALAGCGAGLAFGAKKGPMVRECSWNDSVVRVYELCRFCGIWSCHRYVSILVLMVAVLCVFIAGWSNAIRLHDRTLILAPLINKHVGTVNRGLLRIDRRRTVAFYMTIHKGVYPDREDPVESRESCSHHWNESCR